MTGAIAMGGNAITGGGNFTAASFIPSGSTVPTNGTYLPAANSLGWATNSTLRMQLDANANLILNGGGTATTNYGTAYQTVEAFGSTGAIIRSSGGGTVASPTSAIDFYAESGAGGSGIVRTKTNVPMYLKTNDTVAITIDTSQGVTAANFVATGSATVSDLGTCNSTKKGARYFATDANATTFNTTAAGGGTNNVPVTCNGTNWVIG